MVKSYDWSFLENQLHQIEDIQSKGSSSVTPPMDVTSSIITQVAREADHRNDNSAKGNIGYRLVKVDAKPKMMFLISVMLAVNYRIFFSCLQNTNNA